MTIRKLLKNTLLVLISALAFSCADPGRPDGGAYDETPPSVVGTSPKEYALNNKQQKITLLFSEYIKLDNDSANLGQFFDNMSTYINRVNAGLHGGYAQTEKGAAHMSAVGKLLMQFRQWMPGHYNRRFAKNYYDPATHTGQVSIEQRLLYCSISPRMPSVESLIL